MPVTLLTVSEYARYRGCDEKAVRKALEQGRITRISSDKRCLDPAVADIQWAQNTRARADSSAQSRTAGGSSSAADSGAGKGEAYADHRARREKAEADMAVLEAEKLAGRLMAVEPAERATFDAFRELRDATFAAVRSSAPQLLGMTEVREIQHLLEDALRAAYVDFETRMRHRLQEIART